MEPTMPMGKVKGKDGKRWRWSRQQRYTFRELWTQSNTHRGVPRLHLELARSGKISTGLTLGIHWNFHNRTMDQQWHIASLQLHHQQHQQHQQLHQSCKRHNSTNSDFTTTTYTNCTTHAKTTTSTNSTNATFTKRVVQRTCSCESKASVTWFKRNSTTAHAPTPPNYPPPHATAQLQMLLLQRYSPMDSHILHTNSQGRICRANGRVCRTDKQVPTSSKACNQEANAFTEELKQYHTEQDEHNQTKTIRHWFQKAFKIQDGPGGLDITKANYPINSERSFKSGCQLATEPKKNKTLAVGIVASGHIFQWVAWILFSVWIRLCKRRKRKNNRKVIYWGKSLKILKQLCKNISSQPSPARFRFYQEAQRRSSGSCRNKRKTRKPHANTDCREGTPSHRSRRIQQTYCWTCAQHCWSARRQGESYASHVRAKRFVQKMVATEKKYKADLDQQGVQSGWLKEMVVNYNKITIEEEVEDLRNHLKALQERMAGLGVEDEKVGKIRTKKTRRWKRQSRRSNLRQVRHLQQQHRDLRRWTFKMVETVWCKGI